MEDEPAVYSADNRNALQIEIHCAVGIHRQQPAVLCGVAVLLDNPQGKFQ